MRVLRVLQLIVVSAAFLWVPEVQASAPWVIDRVHTEVEVKDDGRVVVSETVSVNYGENHQTGITRTVPLKLADNENVSFANIEVKKVLRNKVDEPYLLETGEYETRIIIGDDRLSLKDAHEYIIEYEVTGVLHRNGENDRLWWNPSGGWEAHVRQSTAIVRLPRDGIRGQECRVYDAQNQVLEGECQSVGLSPTQARFVATDGLQANGRMEILVDYERDLVERSIVTPPTLLDWIQVYKTPLIILGSISFLSLFFAGWLKWRQSKISPSYSDVNN